MVLMLRKCVGIFFLLVGLLLAVALTAAAGGNNAPGNEIRHSAQVPMSGSNLFGLTVADIYDRGVIVTDVELGSPAKRMNIRKDDVILEVNGISVLSADDFQKLVYEFAGTPIILKVSRFGQINTLIIDAR
jgi:S1-C subfamily serine protease